MEIGIVGSDAAGRSYAGIGSRSTPSSILALMQRLGEVLAQRQWVVRTGGAAGADQAFMEGAQAGGGNVELYLPWRGFQGMRDATLDSRAQRRRRWLRDFILPGIAAGVVRDYFMGAIAIRFWVFSSILRSRSSSVGPQTARWMGGADV